MYFAGLAETKFLYTHSARLLSARDIRPYLADIGRQFSLGNRLGGKAFRARVLHLVGILGDALVFVFAVAWDLREKALRENLPDVLDCRSDFRSRVLFLFRIERAGVFFQPAILKVFGGEYFNAEFPLHKFEWNFFAVWCQRRVVDYKSRGRFLRLVASCFPVCRKIPVQKSDIEKRETKRVGR